MSSGLFYLDFPSSICALDSCCNYSFYYDPEEPPEATAIEMERLNMLAVAIFKYNFDSRGRLPYLLGHRRLVERLIAELFPTDLNQREVSFFYDPELEVGHSIHVYYSRNRYLQHILRYAIRLQMYEYRDRDLLRIRKNMLETVDRLLPSLKKYY